MEMQGSWTGHLVIARNNGDRFEFETVEGMPGTNVQVDVKLEGDEWKIFHCAHQITITKAVKVLWEQRRVVAA